MIKFGLTYDQYFSFLPAKRFAWAILFQSNKIRVIAGDLRRMRMKAGGNFECGWKFKNTSVTCQMRVTWLILTSEWPKYILLLPCSFSIVSVTEIYLQSLAFLTIAYYYFQYKNPLLKTAQRKVYLQNKDCNEFDVCHYYIWWTMWSESVIFGNEKLWCKHVLIGNVIWNIYAVQRYEIHLLR